MAVHAMKPDRSAYSFRPATVKDLPRLQRWLNAPEVQRWWGNPSEQFELLRADLNEPLMTMRIVSLGARPFAYAQDYDVHSWPQPHLAHLPKGSRAIDSFIGWPSMIGRGHGQAYLRVLAERLCAEGAPLIAIDPAEGNLRAQRAYEKAGFRAERMVATEAGPAVLMRYEPRRDGRLAFAVPKVVEADLRSRGIGLAPDACSTHIGESERSGVQAGPGAAMPKALSNIRVKRLYDPPDAEDGARVLVDRLWPRGATKEEAKLTLWLKDIAPSAELRKWFGHDPARFAEFSRRYRAELSASKDAVSRLEQLVRAGPVTLLYAAHDEKHNNALVLADYLKARAVGG
jgi:aminoglycoside 6'-N-acetyltransferase